MEDIVVADPNNVDNVGMEILDNKSKYLHEHVIDFDLKALYPSIIMTLNISPETCIGKIVIEGAEEDEDIGNEFMDDYSSKDYVNLGQKWFNTPTLSNLIAKFENS